MKKIILILTISIVLILAACNGSSSGGNDEKEVYTLKFATAQSENHSLTQEVFKPYMEEVTDRTDGQVEFEFYPAEQLGQAADLYDLVKDNVADIGYYIATYYPENMPLTSDMIGIPGLYDTAHEGTMAYHEISKESPLLESDFLDNGVRPIWSYTAPSGEIFTKGKEVRVPEDVKGLKIRTTGEVLNKATTTLGATPVNITLSEMYEAFDRNVYDAINLNTQSLHDYGLGELVEFGTKGINFGGSGTGLIINESAYQSLPEDVQEIMIEVGDELTEKNAIRTDEYIEEIYQEYEDEGKTIHEITEEEEKEWNKVFEEFRKKYEKEVDHPEFESTLKKFITILESNE